MFQIKSNLIGAFMMLLLVPNMIWAQNKTQKGTSKDGKYAYTYVSNDPLNLRIYTLKNGLKVYASVNKKAPRIQTFIAVKAGSKNDPADNTGLAHYLEHLLFKGTDKYGSLDYAKEKVYLDEIEKLYEVYNKETDAAKRKSIYAKIDSVSNLASKFAIANEYDKMTTTIGAQGTNAFTSFEQTVYVNDIPSNEIDRWLMLESERFRNPVLRLFHTELEAVYEEKNISLDNDNRKVSETLLAEVFKTHPYGTQTTIGTIEHLKNPSIKKIKDYYTQNYVSNNMAIVIAGDFDPETVIPKIDMSFSYMKPSVIKPFTFTPEQEINSPIEKTVVGPDAEFINIAYRIPGTSHEDMLTLKLIDIILANKGAGLIDLNLNNQQKLIAGGSYIWNLKDYSIHFMTGKPRQGQDLNEVKSLLLDQIEKIKKGDFDEKVLKGIILNAEIDRIKEAEENANRGYIALDYFTQDLNWEAYVNEIDLMKKITKAQIVAIANKYYKNNYISVAKKKGAKVEVQKVDKPQITPVDVNRDNESEFVKNIKSKQPTPIQPVYLDFTKDFQKIINKNFPIHSIQNKENKLFSLYYLLDIGTENDLKMSFAVNYSKYLGTDKYSSEELAKKFFDLGCSFNVFTSGDQSYVMLTGHEDYFEQGLALFEEFLKTAKPNQAALDNLINDELKKRADAKLNKRNILWGAMNNWATYGKNSPFLNFIPEAELKALKAEELVGYVKTLTSYPHKVMYYGPKPQIQLVEMINKYHQVPATFKAVPASKKFTRNETNENKVFFVDYNMVQAELVWMSKSENYNPANEAIVKLYNEYFGGGMSSLVFQTIRESKALAYSTFSQYRTPSKKEDPFYSISYVGTQSDKINDAATAMLELLNEMPKADLNFKNAIGAIKNEIETERITKESILFEYESLKKLGLNYDIRKDIYSNIGKLTFQDLSAWQSKIIKNKPRYMLVLGSKDKVNLKDLEKYGKVEVLKMEDIFGY